MANQGANVLPALLIGGAIIGAALIAVQKQQQTARTGAYGQVTYCECPKCGYRVPHTPQIPCTQYTCPNCGASMRGPCI